jgi:hypothetical protein
MRVSRINLVYAARFTDALVSAEIGTVEAVKSPMVTRGSNNFFIDNLTVKSVPYPLL